MVRKVSLWDKVFKPLKDLGQSTCKSLLSSCIYLQREKYLKMTQPTNPSFLSPEHSQTHTVQYAQLVLTPTASPFRMCSGWSQAHLGCKAAGLCVTSFLVVKEDGFPSGRSLSVVGWDSGSFCLVAVLCWTIITFFVSTRWATVSALCCSIHSSLYLCWRMSKMGVGGLENIEKKTI